MRELRLKKGESITISCDAEGVTSVRITEASANAEPTDTIEVGDRVRIINTGCMYSTNFPWVSKYIEDKNMCVRYAYGDDLGYEAGVREHNAVFVVRFINDIMAYIELERANGLDRQHNSCYLINVDGLKKI